MEWPTNLQLPSGQRQTTLVEQPKGKDLEYCIIAVNKAGEGEARNTAMVVL